MWGGQTIGGWWVVVVVEVVGGGGSRGGSRGESRVKVVAVVVVDLRNQMTGVDFDWFFRHRSTCNGQIFIA
jgi:hypothetical protein